MARKSSYIYPDSMCFANFLFLPQTWGITGVFGVILYDGEKLKIELENMLTRDDYKYFHSSKIFLTS